MEHLALLALTAVLLVLASWGALRSRARRRRLERACMAADAALEQLDRSALRLDSLLADTGARARPLEGDGIAAPNITGTHD